MADITDATGKFVTDNTLKGRCHLDRIIMYKWPPQENLSPTAWMLLRKIIRQTLCILLTVACASLWDPGYAPPFTTMEVLFSVKADLSQRKHVIVIYFYLSPS